jgi:prepilin-type processing-associated H-X9-DG protein
VELLVVIAIIGILVTLLLPAVNTARETARRSVCANNVKQMALACLNHESKYQYLPTGGWGWQWAADPNLGVGRTQPGGWHFNILPFVDQVDLHNIGFNSSGGHQDPAVAMTRAQMPIALFICPTRRKLQVYPRTLRNDYVNINDPSPIIGRSDYAANGGDQLSTVQPGNANGAYDPKFDWSTVSGTINSSNSNGGPATGVIFRASQLPISAIKDGASFTYLLGERYLNVDAYLTGGDCDNDQGWDEGFDYDTIRWTLAPPWQDRPGVGGCMTLFGSSHENGFNMAFCDGSVKKIGYDIDPNVHMQLGNRYDQQPRNLDDTIFSNY